MSETLHLAERTEQIKNRRIICLIDGEHYPPVTKSALRELQNTGADIVGLIFLGGTEKVENPMDELASDDDSYQIYSGDDSIETVLQNIHRAAEEQKPEIAIDLSDEPVVDYRERFRIISHLLIEEIGYINADTSFSPPTFEDVLEKPSLGIIGTGKRVGKTAVSVSVSRYLKEQGVTPAVMAMGRGGPGEPEVIMPDEVSLSVEFLMEHLEQGKHVASDYWEDALLAQVPTVGCRRCGGGMSGNPFMSNVLAGVKKANRLPVDLIIMEGSGQTMAPVQTDANILIANVNQPAEYVTGYLGEYRVLKSDLVIFTNAGELRDNSQRLRQRQNEISAINPDAEVAFTMFRPEPLDDIQGKRVFMATTAPESALPEMAGYLEENYDCKVVGTSGHLSDRAALREDLHAMDSAAEVFLTELKAASIDVGGKMAAEKSLELIFMHNRAEIIGGTIQNLHQALLRLCDKIGVEGVSV
jgi:cyclic 2,3-diphosphoglycerate synthetase